MSNTKKGYIVNFEKCLSCKGTGKDIGYETTKFCTGVPICKICKGVGGFYNDGENKNKNKGKKING